MKLALLSDTHDPCGKAAALPAVRGGLGASYELVRSRCWRSSWAASSISLWRHSAAR
jgi:hypothetical protein